MFPSDLPGSFLLVPTIPHFVFLMYNIVLGHLLRQRHLNLGIFPFNFISLKDGVIDTSHMLVDLEVNDFNYMVIQ